MLEYYDELEWHRRGEAPNASSSIHMGRPVVVYDTCSCVVQRARLLHIFGPMQHVLRTYANDNDTTTSIPYKTPVLVRRAGYVIPQVVQRVKNVTPLPPTNDDTCSISLEVPTHCPGACGSRPQQPPAIIEEKSDKNAVGQVLRCGGPSLLCPPLALVRNRLPMPSMLERDRERCAAGCLWVLGSTD
jgi:hypothetical protein